MPALLSHDDPMPVERLNERPDGATGAASSVQGEPCNELRGAALRAWRLAEPRAKAQAALDIGRQLASASWLIDAERAFDDERRPGRPSTPRLVHPRDVPNRGAGTPAGRAALLHAIAHIEFNAIDLALDAVWRFPDMPSDWYLDWASVASEEAAHFSLLADELERRGHRYGDFDAHDGLWEMALKTRDDPLPRMALVPRLMEARGLDVTPIIRRKLEQAGDVQACAILDVILRDEVGHVAIGNHWYGVMCRRQGLDPEAAWDTLARRYGASAPKAPFNVEARLRAGFTQAELLAWQSDQGPAGRADP
jgi:uncharacterized ferritin-like protein (DUF455 family)